MSPAGKPPTELMEICCRWADAVGAISSSNERMEFLREQLPELLVNRALFADILKRLVSGGSYPDLRQGTMFANELVLFQHPGRLFSLRAYIFGSGELTAVHDHLAWGVSGSAIGKLEVTRYRRQDDGSLPELAQLESEDRFVLSPGETEVTLPFDQGIHRTGNPFDGATFMVSVYGPPRRRLYIQQFNIENGRVQRIFPQRIKKRMLAEQALTAMEAV